MNHRRTALIACGALLLTTALSASDPIVGAWKLNVTKSRMPLTDTALKDQTEIYRELPGGEVELTFSRTFANGSSEASKFTWPAQGGAAKILEGKYPEDSSFVEIAIKPGEWYVAYMLNGRQLAVMHKLIIRDTMRETIRGADAQGKPIEYFLILDRK